MTGLTALLLIVLLAGFALAVPMHMRPTLPFGVQVAAVRAADPAIVRTRRTYLLRVTAVSVIAVVVCVAAYGNALIAGTLANSLVVAHGACYVLAHRRLRETKRAEWWQAEHRYGVTTDTTLRTDPVRVSLLWLTPAVVVMVVTMALGHWDIVIPMAVMTVLMPLAVRLGVRTRPDLDAAQPVGSARRYRVYLRGTGRMLMLLVGATNLTILLGATQSSEPFAAVPSLAVVIVFVAWSVRVGQAGHRLPKLPGEEDEDTGLTQRDDDRRWHLGGLVYLNRQDPAVFVHKRVGIGWTMNLGHPVSWAVLVVLVLVAAMAGLGVVDLPQRENAF
ncbi:DUF1648 domain-containing protein [Kibdelosporangium phytohabitans]|uniref:DUF5808 domain-containing protein n=1 Tax=Kibdelosporangium phytohabitans TaxID=860235 RepID=A0A0N9HYS9_9PSEU|nr:DUF5808 domain-containing protein [Kibdelosporangium phytohabitans]ALG07482.1 hypothetical protein AOZ06_11655 [Kibdelosporangium phytohabitans]MBE1471606.1 putative membrane protein [Kibdelosporangium phytohabitans]